MIGIEVVPKVALYVDAANLIWPLEQEFAPFRLARIISRVREEGMILLSRSYADWSREPCSAYVGQFHGQGMEMIEAYADEKRKNTADMLITTEALEHCYSDHPADIYALVSGDRDFVPLVQALHRRGKTVLCIGITSRTSGSLRRICDIYIDYYNLIPRARSFAPPREEEAVEPRPLAAASGEVEETPGDERIQAFQVLRRAVVALMRRGDEPRGARVHVMIRQLKPDFDFQHIGYDSYREFVEDAVAGDWVHFAGEPEAGADFILSAVGEAVQEEEPPQPRFETVTVTPDAVLGKYRDILEFKRIPWVPWNYRLPLIGHLWARLQGSLMTISQMSELMESFASDKGWEISSQAIYKLTYTLNIGLCFSLDGRPAFVRDIFNSQLGASVDLHESLERMHVTYIRGIRLEAPNIPLLAEAVCELLFGEKTPTYLAQSRSLIAKVENN